MAQVLTRARKWIISSVIASHIFGLPHVDFKNPNGVEITMVTPALAQTPIQNPIQEFKSILYSPKPDITRAKAILNTSTYSQKAYAEILNAARDIAARVHANQSLEKSPDKLVETAKSIVQGTSFEGTFVKDAYPVLLAAVKDVVQTVLEKKPVSVDPLSVVRSARLLTEGATNVEGTDYDVKFKEQDIPELISGNAALVAHVEGYSASLNGRPPQVLDFFVYVFEKEKPTVVVPARVSTNVSDTLDVFKVFLLTNDSGVIDDFKRAYSSLNADEKKAFEAQFKSRFAGIYKGYTEPNKGTTRAFNVLDCVERIGKLHLTRAQGMPDERSFVRYGEQFVRSVPPVSEQANLGTSSSDISKRLELGKKFVAGIEKLLAEKEIGDDPLTLLQDTRTRLVAFKQGIGPFLGTADSQALDKIIEEMKTSAQALVDSRQLGASVDEQAFLLELKNNLNSWKGALAGIAKNTRESLFSLGKTADTLAHEFDAVNIRPTTFDLTRNSPLGAFEGALAANPLFARAMLAQDAQTLMGEIEAYTSNLAAISDDAERIALAARMTSIVNSWKSRVKSIGDRYADLYGDADGSKRQALTEAVRVANPQDVSQLFSSLESLELSQKYVAFEQEQTAKAGSARTYLGAHRDLQGLLKRISGVAVLDQPRAIRDNMDDLNESIEKVKTSLAAIGINDPSLNQRSGEALFNYAVRLEKLLNEQAYDVAANLYIDNANVLPVIGEYVAVRTEIQARAFDRLFASEQHRVQNTPESQEALRVATQAYENSNPQWIAKMQTVLGKFREFTSGTSRVGMIRAFEGTSSVLDGDSQLGTYILLTQTIVRAKSDLARLSAKQTAYERKETNVPLTSDEVKAVVDNIPNPDVLRYYLAEGMKATERIVGYYDGTRPGAPYVLNHAWIENMRKFVDRAKTTVEAGVFSGNVEQEIGPIVFRAYLAKHGLGDLDTLLDTITKVERALNNVEARLATLYVVQNTGSLDALDASLDDQIDTNKRLHADDPDEIERLNAPLKTLKAMSTSARASGQDLTALLRSSQTKEYLLKQYEEIEGIITNDVPSELRERFAMQFYSSWNKTISPRDVNDYTELRSSIRTIFADQRFMAFDATMPKSAREGGLAGRPISAFNTYNFTLQGPTTEQGNATNAGTGPVQVNSTTQEVKLNDNGEVLTAWTLLTPDIKYAIYQLMASKYGADWNTQGEAFDQFAVLVLSMQANSQFNQNQGFAPLHSSYGALFLSKVGLEILRFNDPAMTQFLINFFTSQSFIALNVGDPRMLEKYFDHAAEKLREIYPTIFDLEGNYREDQRDNRIRLPSENVAELTPSKGLAGNINLPPEVYSQFRNFVEGVVRKEQAYIQGQPGQTPNVPIVEADFRGKMIDVRISIPTTAITLLRILPDMSELVLDVHPMSGEFLDIGGGVVYSGYKTETELFTDITSGLAGGLASVHSSNVNVNDQRDWQLKLNATGEGKSAQVEGQMRDTKQTTEEIITGSGSSTTDTTERVRVSGNVQNQQFVDEEGGRAALYGTLEIDKETATTKGTVTTRPDERTEVVEHLPEDERKTRDLIEASAKVIDMKDPRFQYAYYMRHEWVPGMQNPLNPDEEPGGYMTHIYMYGKTDRGFVLMQERTIPFEEARTLYRTFIPLEKSLEMMHGEVKERIGPVDFKTSITGFFVSEALINGRDSNINTSPVMQGLSVAGQLSPEMPIGMVVMHETTRAGRTAVGGGGFGKQRQGSLTGFTYGHQAVRSPSESEPADARARKIRELQADAQNVQEGYQAEFMYTTSGTLAVRAFAGLQQLTKDQKQDPEAIFGALVQANIDGYHARFSMLSNQAQSIDSRGNPSGEATRSVGASLVAPSLVDAIITYAIAKKAMDEEWGGVGKDHLQQAAAAVQYYFSKNPLNNRFIGAGVWNEESWRTAITQFTHYMGDPDNPGDLMLGIDEVTGGYTLLTAKGEPLYHLGQLYFGKAPGETGMDIELIGAGGGNKLGGALKLDFELANRDFFATGGGVLMPFAQAVFGGMSLQLAPSTRVFAYGTYGSEKLTGVESVLTSQNPEVTSGQALAGISFDLEPLHPTLFGANATLFVSGISQEENPNGAPKSDASQMDAGFIFGGLAWDTRLQLTVAGQVWESEQKGMGTSSFDENQISWSLQNPKASRESLVTRVGAEWLGAGWLSRFALDLTGTYFSQTQRTKDNEGSLTLSDGFLDLSRRSTLDRSTGYSIIFNFTGQN